MPSVRVRRPCPVCLGTNLTNVEVGDSGTLVLEHCARCGGVWFPAGGVERVRRVGSEVLWRAIAAKPETPRMACRGCTMRLPRDAAVCPACGWSNQVDCPVCLVPMEVGAVGGTRLDACRRCKGTWFDHVELKAIWDAQFQVALGKVPRPGAGSRAMVGEGALGVAEVLAWNPGLAAGLVQLAAESGGNMGDVLAASPNAVGGLGEAIGETASSVFEKLIEIIADVLS